jgi:AcrR family transcriptional regulator
LTENRIKEVALSHFAHHGFEGASLANIAEEVGIKKASIYSHYKGKDELFLTLIRDVAEDEMRFFSSFFQTYSDLSLQDRLHRFLVHYKERYEYDDKTKFWMRMAFFPSAHLQDQILTHVYAYLDTFESFLIPIFQQAIDAGEIEAVDAEQAAVGYLGLLDSVLVEMLYGGPERFAKRLDACWHLYWRALTMKQ